MEYRQLGNSGVRVSIMGLGTNRFGSDVMPQNDVNKIIDAALDLGINFIDTANRYTGGKSEETLGNALKGRRHKFILATKFAFPQKDGPNTWGAARYHLMESIDASLRRLQTDHIDLYFVHRWDDTTPIQETLRGLDDLVRMGKVCYVGASAFASWQLAHANLLAEVRGWSPFVVIQSHYHMLERGVEREVLPYCRAHKVGFIPFYPMAGGFLTGKYKRGEPAPKGSRGETNPYVKEYMTDANYDKLDKLTAFAKACGHNMNELAQAWILAQPQVCAVISGLTKLEHLLNNVKGFEWTLKPEELKEVERILG